MIGKCEGVETKSNCWDGRTGNDLDYKSATQRNHRARNYLKDTDKCLTHVLKLFLQEADPQQMKTADSNNTEPRLIGTRRLMTLTLNYLTKN